MAAMEKSVAQGRSVQFSSMVCNNMESKTRTSLLCDRNTVRTTWFQCFETRHRTTAVLSSSGFPHLLSARWHVVSTAAAGLFLFFMSLPEE